MVKFFITNVSASLSASKEVFRNSAVNKFPSCMLQPEGVGWTSSLIWIFSVNAAAA